MAVRHHPAARTDGSPVDGDRPVIVFEPEPTRPSRPTRRLWLGVALLAVAALGAGSWWMASGDEKVVARPATPPPAATVADVPAGLALTVDGPEAVVAGQRARFRVSYSDAEGIFSGSLEDWGDIGVGSMEQAACRSDAPAAAALRDSYVVAHKWRRAGSYPVSFAVTTYTCANGRATEETRDAQLTVVVGAR
jgi:hypothetical protein